MLGANSLRPYRELYCENNTAYESDHTNTQRTNKKNQLKLERLHLLLQYKFITKTFIDNGVTTPAV